MQGNVKILSTTEGGLKFSAAAARVATVNGTAEQIYEKSNDPEKNLSLVLKVLSSGHESILEHLLIHLAFTDVSVLVEQYMIEHRLASFFVKSRRYVDFGKSGYYVPEGAGQEFTATMDRRFSGYNALLEQGVPKEDARFVLPYCFHSNFFVSLNARVLLHIIGDMTYGRGSAYPEIRELGTSLRQQFEKDFHGVADFITQKQTTYNRPKFAPLKRDPEPKNTDVELLSSPTDPKALLNAVISESMRFSHEDYSTLLKDARPRELEHLHYTFKIKNASLACVTHFARHRMYSPIFPEIQSAVISGGYVLPETVLSNPEAEAIYKNAFSDQAISAYIYRKEHPQDEALSYFALAGNTIDFVMTTNARQLIVFSKLRMCRRAQWEIQSFSGQMLALLRENFPALFSLYGPSCLMDGKCPEGRLSCGQPFTE